MNITFKVRGIIELNKGGSMLTDKEKEGFKKIKINGGKDRISKRTKKLNTVDTYLTKDNINDVINCLSADKENITELICVYITREGGIVFTTDDEQTASMSIYMLESEVSNTERYERSM